ncbi:MAG: SDR family NAD(P)-dependent oxidoreductase [Gammaproteobacteria bacterium]|nr:SDR family NAD(P)-dependent oxidoreductase [Gammaproteobacteria bacterium]
MKNVLGYEGGKVVITGAASGMGAAAARLPVELGAEVHALDIGEVNAPVAKAIRTDMKNKASIDAALAQLRGEIYALFNCAGVPHPPFSAFDTMMINFVGRPKYLTDALLPRIGRAAPSHRSPPPRAWGGKPISSWSGNSWRSRASTRPRPG